MPETNPNTVNQLHLKSAVSFQCMTKSTTNKKNNNNKKEKKIVSISPHHQFLYFQLLPLVDNTLFSPALKIH